MGVFGSLAVCKAESSIAGGSETGKFRLGDFVCVWAHRACHSRGTLWQGEYCYLLNPLAVFLHCSIKTWRGMSDLIASTTPADYTILS